MVLGVAWAALGLAPAQRSALQPPRPQWETSTEALFQNVFGHRAHSWTVCSANSTDPEQETGRDGAPQEAILPREGLAFPVAHDVRHSHIPVDILVESHKLAVVLEEVKGRGADFRHLREVRLVDCLITDEKLAVLVAALGQGCVSVLALGGNQISNIGARTLGEALAALAPLRELHLNGNCIADPGVEALCKGLFGHLTAAEKKENLRKAKRLQRMASAKAKRLNVKGKSTSLTPPPKAKEQPPSRLAVLDLCSNPVSPEGARALAESLTLDRCRLTTLRLDNCYKCTEPFVQAIAEELPFVEYAEGWYGLQALEDADERITLTELRRRQRPHRLADGEGCALLLRLGRLLERR